MNLAEVPASLIADRCLRCGDYLAIDPDLSPVQRHEVSTEHHLYLCSSPTPNVALWRAVGFPESGPPPA